MPARLDHLVVTAPTLAAGVAHVQAQLGVSPMPGGRHARMGTHNCLLKLGPAAYLEVIAVDPQAGVPDLPRWFRLDRGDPPRLATWVARTGDLQAAVSAQGAYRHIEAMERGALRWAITLFEQGDLPFDGIAPTLIQWRTQAHPAAALPESGCTLTGLDGRHPRAAEVADLLRTIRFQDEFNVSIRPGPTPGLVATLLTPEGPRTLA